MIPKRETFVAGSVSGYNETSWTPKLLGGYSLSAVALDSQGRSNISSTVLVMIKYQGWFSGGEGLFPETMVFPEVEETAGRVKEQGREQAESLAEVVAPREEGRHREAEAMGWEILRETMARIRTGMD